MRRLAILAVAAAAAVALTAAPAAQADSSDVTGADVALRLADDASLLVSETLTFDYEGSFEASYRDIELLHGERITDLVGERGRPALRARRLHVASAATTATSTFGVEQRRRRHPGRVAPRRHRRGAHLRRSPIA